MKDFWYWFAVLFDGWLFFQLGQAALKNALDGRWPHAAGLGALWLATGALTAWWLSDIFPVP